MMIQNEFQYNEPVDKSKIVSSTSGVGSIIVSKFGYYFLVESINNWPFIREANQNLNIIVKSLGTSPDQEQYERVRQSLLDIGNNIIDDFRFIEFLRISLGLKNLTCLVEIPHMGLHDYFNSAEWQEHPINKFLQSKDVNKNPEDFMLSASHFPKWFKNESGKMMQYDKWLEKWITKYDEEFGAKLPKNAFVPPRDADGVIKKDGADQTVKYFEKKIKRYKLLEQLNRVLICPNGHLSDIPWPKYLNWRTQILTGKSEDRNGKNLFAMNDCCDTPDLKWSENKTRGEGNSSIFIECRCCKKGTKDNGDHPKVSLEGIDNLRPYCRGERPWEFSPENMIGDNCLTQDNSSESMRVSLVTGNSVFFLTSKSSIYIPPSKQVNERALQNIETTFSRYTLKNPDISRDDFWVKYHRSKFNDLEIEQFASEYGFDLSNIDYVIDQLKTAFLDKKRPNALNDEEYRFQEYNFFESHISYEDEKLKFHEVDISDEMYLYFRRISKITDLCLTNVQAGFSRVRPVYDNGAAQQMMPTYSGSADNIFAIPAGVTFGEGLFFQMDDGKIETWLEGNFAESYQQLFERNLEINETGYHLKLDLMQKRHKKLLIHTLSHLLMRELEYSCGYPTSSLAERLYISNVMSGFLIYTVDGSEGSMGGLIAQAEPGRFEYLLKKSLRRALSCSGDPLCWQNEPNGLYNLNLAACFSCSMVSETACEEMNLALDRRVLVDEEFGFFKDLIY